VARLDHHADTPGADLLHHDLRDLLGEPLLQLQAPREDVHQARELRHAEYLAVRDVADVAAAVERQQVVLAHAVELDVLDDHHAAGRLREERLIDHGAHVGPVAVREEGERLRHAARRLQQSFAIGVFAELDQELAHEAFDLAEVRLHRPNPASQVPEIERIGVEDQHVGELAGRERAHVAAHRSCAVRRRRAQHLQIREAGQRHERHLAEHRPGDRFLRGEAVARLGDEPDLDEVGLAGQLIRDQRTRLIERGDLDDRRSPMPSLTRSTIEMRGAASVYGMTALKSATSGRV